MATATAPRDADTAALQHELQQRIAGDVRFDDFSRVLYSTDASIYQMKPIGVVIPPQCRRRASRHRSRRQARRPHPPPLRWHQPCRSGRQHRLGARLQQAHEPTLGGERRGRVGTGPAGHRAGPPQPRALLPRLSLRPRPNHIEPRLRRWGHRQQHLRLPLSDLRQDRRPRHGGPDRPLRRQPGPFRPHRRL